MNYVWDNRLSRLIVWLAFYVLMFVSCHTAAEEKSNQKSKEALPLQPDTFLTFSVEQASWLSLDVAPVGEQMVIEVLGDLYLLPISGGVASN